MAKRIDRETVQRIIDAADIVEVVSDFVTLKRRGANYIGLCPFHNERTPSFSVSKAKGICKCFSCGKGGSPVNFIMEIEQLTYYEALRYLARKYGIEIQERELTAEEQEAETARESMLAVNEFAMNHFARNLTETQAGRDIGLAYFRERGINDAMIKRFDLGYALDERDDLLRTALEAGYNEKYLIDTGLCSKNDQGRVFDRFRGRVIYPIRSLSGKVVAFGGRILRNDKNLAKYVNSPESIIYSKRAELYGLHQARQAINKKDKCILVEGYMDVISMHQSGIENVVASSGTSLTERQVNLIHRFTENVTVIYDSDAAGIKASLRGIDMLLAEGLNVKVLLLPEGDDPDSFAQSHSSSEVETYISGNETDFIRFKTRILLEGAEGDPIARSRAITEIVRSIAVIPSEIQRTVYVQECSRMLDIDEGVLSAQMVKFMAENARKSREDHQRERERAALDADPDTALITPEQAQPNQQAASTPTHTEQLDDTRFLRNYELQVLKYAVKYGMVLLGDITDDSEFGDGSVIAYVASELAIDDLTFSNSDIADTFAAAKHLADENWAADYAMQRAHAAQATATRRAEGHQKIRENATGGMAEIGRMEKELEERLASMELADDDEYRSAYIARTLVNDPDDRVRVLATELVAEKYVLSKIHTKYARVETERDRLPELVTRAVYELKDAILTCRARKLRNDIKTLSIQQQPDMAQLRELMEQAIEIDRLKGEFAKSLGDRIISPRK